MQKIVKILLGCLFACLVLTSCTKEEQKKTLKVGMVTDAGTIDDKSFNQGTWEGIKRAEKELGVEIKYLKPVGTTEADYIKEISNLYDAGYKFIICPGFKFETAVFKAQSKYKDAKFVIIDGNAHPADSYDPQNGPNTIGISFLENEAAFLAGIAAALQFQKGNFGFIGGMEIPAVKNLIGAGSRVLNTQTNISELKLKWMKRISYIRAVFPILRQVSKLRLLCMIGV